MNNRYRIYWLLNAFVDIKVSISPRVEMIKELSRNGHEIVLVTSYKKRKLQLGVNTKYIKTTNIPLCSRIHFIYKCYRKMLKEYNLSQENIIIIADQNSLYSALLLKLKYKLIKKRINVHFDIRTIPVEIKGIKGVIENLIFWYPALKLASYFADSVSFISKDIKKIADYKNKKYCIWSSGVNIDKFKLVNKNIENKQLFYHGVITKNRGLRETIYAIEKIKDIIKNIKLVIVGDGDDLENLKKIVKNKKLENYIKFTGRVDYKDIHQNIKNAKICICPLPDILWWRVSSPLKVIEYLAMGKPCILTEINPHKKLINSDTKGIYWAGKGTSEEIAKSIIEAFKDENNFYSYRKNLRRIAEENSWEKKACLLVNYWNNIYYL
jgi:glycosyltransferase involved in cell wall biosynthesis